MRYVTNGKVQEQTLLTVDRLVMGCNLSRLTMVEGELRVCHPTMVDVVASASSQEEVFYPPADEAAFYLTADAVRKIEIHVSAPDM